MSQGWWRLRAACGLAGPVAFTAAWTASTVRQVGYSIAEGHLSGLAAPDARDPEIMIAGFVALGACTVAFASALEDALGGRGRAGRGPLLVRIAGTATVAAGLLRRDQMLLHPPDAPGGQSWHNHGHDLASLAIYATLIAAPLVLAGRLRDHPRLAGVRPAAIATSAASTTLLLLFWSRALEPWNGIVQRVAVSVPLVGMAVLAAELLRRERADRGERDERTGREDRRAVRR
jgi:hypothetical protein